MAIEKLPKLMLDADGHGFYQADDAEPEDAVCEYSKAQAHIDRLKQENAELKAQLERISAPVSAKEWEQQSERMELGETASSRWRFMQRGAVSELIASRAEKGDADATT